MGGVGKSGVAWGSIDAAVSCRCMGGLSNSGAAATGVVSCRWVMGISGAAAGIVANGAAGEAVAGCWVDEVVRSAAVAEGAASCR